MMDERPTSSVAGQSHVGVLRRVIEMTRSGTTAAHVAAQPGDQLLDHFFVGRTERRFCGR
jgi:hypothetical protein